jgi:hypothetical protein
MREARRAGWTCRPGAGETRVARYALSMHPLARHLLLGLAIALAGGACQRRAPRRSTPVCAVQDCRTHRIIDDGCASDGRCASCVNACPPDPPR